MIDQTLCFLNASPWYVHHNSMIIAFKPYQIPLNPFKTSSNPIRFPLTPMKTCINLIKGPLSPIETTLKSSKTTIEPPWSCWLHSLLAPRQAHTASWGAWRCPSLPWEAPGWRCPWRLAPTCAADASGSWWFDGNFMVILCFCLCVFEANLMGLHGGFNANLMGIYCTVAGTLWGFNGGSWFMVVSGRMHGN